MPLRFRRSRTERTRRQRKALFIHVKNTMNDPELGHGEGHIRWSTHVMPGTKADGTSGWHHLDFKFLSRVHKGRYYFVSMQTTAYQVAVDLENEIDAQLEIDHPLPDPGLNTRKVPGRSTYTWEVGPAFRRVAALRHELMTQQMNARRTEQRTVMEKDVWSDYGPVSVGISSVIHTDFLTDAFISGWIAGFLETWDKQPIRYGVRTMTQRTASTEALGGQLDYIHISAIVG